MLNLFHSKYDDTSITSSGTDIHLIELKVNEDLKQLENWLVTNRLSINVVKTEFMIIGSRQRLGQVNLDLNLKDWGKQSKESRKNSVTGCHPR